MAFTDVVHEFELTLSEVEANLAFLRASARLRPRLNPFLNWQHFGQDQNAKKLVTDFLACKEIELTPQYRGMVVVISGAFEHAVRRILEEAISAYSSTRRGFASIPQHIRDQNMIRTGRALTRFREPLDHAPLDHQSLVERLASCKPDAEAFHLNPEVFSCCVSSITPGHLEEIFEWIDTKLNWDDFGRNGDFEKLLGTTGAKATGKGVEERLRQFTKLRNNIAHAGGGNLRVTDDEVDIFIRFFRILVSCISERVGYRVKQI